MILPLVLCNPFVKPICRVLGHEYWTPLGRLIFGVFLINTVFMEYYVYSLESGLWLQRSDVFLMFLSFLTLSFIFSILGYLTVDGPASGLVKKLISTEVFKPD